MKKTICIAALSAAMTFAAANSFAASLMLGPWADYEYYQHATTTYAGGTTYPGQWVDGTTGTLTFNFNLTDPNPAGGTTNSLLGFIDDVTGYGPDNGWPIVKDVWATLAIFSIDDDKEAYDFNVTAYVNNTSYLLDSTTFSVQENDPFKYITYKFGGNLLNAWKLDPSGLLSLAITPTTITMPNGDQVANDFQLLEVGVGATPVPEPATMLLFGTGLAGLAAVARRRKTQG